MGRVQNCLLCYGESITVNCTSTAATDFFGASGQLAQQIAIIFVVRKILNIPKSACQKLLEDLGNPSSWRIGYCAKCTNIIQEAQFVAERLEDLQQKLSNLSLKIKSQLYQNYAVKEKARARRSVGNWEAVDEIRFQFSKEFSRPKRASQTTFENNVGNNNIEWKRTVDTGEQEFAELCMDDDLNVATEKCESTQMLSGGCGNPEIDPLDLDYDNNSIGLDWYPSEEDNCSDNDYKPPSSKSSNSICKRKRKNSKGKVIQTICTDAAVKIEQPEQIFCDQSGGIENPIEFDAECEERKQLLSADNNSGSSKGVFNCSICGFKLNSALSRDAHEKRVHMGIRDAFECDVCKKAFRKKCEMEAHRKLHFASNNLFLCPKCLRKFPTKICRNAHVQKFHNGIKDPYKCTQCGKKFQKPVSLESHLKSKHNIVLTEPLSDANRKEIYRKKLESGWKKNSVVGQQKGQTFKCTVEESCAKLYFFSEVSRDAHVKRIHEGVKCPYECSLCSKKFSRQALLNDHKCNGTSAEKVSVTKQTFPCEECGNGKVFRTRYLLNVHLRSSIHRKGPKPFMCEICSKTFQSQKFLEEHQKLIHHEELDLTPRQCPECGKKIGSERTLQYHIRSVHKKEYNFVCDFCPVGFAHENAKLSHMKIHTGERPWKCPVCPKAFIQKWQLALHNRIHTGEKPYKCKDCGKMFSDHPTFKRHLEMHKGILHECSICFKKYATRHAFRVHMKLHESRGKRVMPKSSMITRTGQSVQESIPIATEGVVNCMSQSSNCNDSVPLSSQKYSEIHTDPNPHESVQSEPCSSEFQDMPQLFAASMLN